MKVVVYTVILGGYDRLRNHDDLPYDFIAYIDDTSIVPANTNWQIRSIPQEYNNTNMTPKKLSTLLKMIPHKLFPEYDISVYIDGKVSINKNIETLIEMNYEDNRLLSNKHPLRQCLYDEITALRTIQWENPTTCDAVERLFKETHFPKNYGMVDTCMLIRRHNDPYIIDLMEENIRLLDAYNITRHELIFNYVLWKQHKTISVVPFDNYRSKFFTQYPHYKHHYKVK